MRLPYTYWKTNEGWYVGYMNQYPEHWTQGSSIKELEYMLISLYNDIITF